MKTICISIGNSDNRLTQEEWNRFYRATRERIEAHCSQIHFFGGSSTWERWQNVCWWIDIREEQVQSLKHSLKLVREDYGQDSVAWLEGRTEFV